MEQEGKTACTNNIQQMGPHDLLVSFRNSVNYGHSEDTGRQCIEHVEYLIKRDNLLLEHWLRTLKKLRNSLNYWIEVRIPKILKEEVNTGTSKHYTSIKRSIHEKKIFMNGIQKGTILLNKSRQSFIYLEEVNKMIRLITKQNRKWENYDFDFNVNLLDNCPDKMEYRDLYKVYFDAWPNKVLDEDVDTLDGMFEELIQNFGLDVTTEEINVMNREYNNFLEWLTDYKKKIIKEKEITQEMINEIIPNRYINMARDYARSKKMTPL